MQAVVWLKKIPWSIIFPSLLLLGLGWLSLRRAEALAGGEGLLRRQIIFSVIALVAAIAVAVPDYRRFGRWSYAIFAAAIVSLVFVFCFPPTNYSHRWIPLVFIKIQPSEFAKIAFILAVSHYLATRENCRRMQDLAIPFLLAVVPMLLILLEPDIGMALVFLPVLFAMLATAGARRFHGILILAVGLAFIPIAWKHLGTDHKSRVIALFEQPLPNETPSKTAYQLHQAKQMRAMGGLWGSYWTGPYSDNRADYHLPESENDFIVCVLGERFGLPGLAILLLLFAFLVWQAAKIALAAPDSFGRLTAIGIATLFAVEMLINVGMSVGLVPITGLALPFLSYGGSNLLAHALAVGLLINIGIRSGTDFQPVALS